MTEAESKIAVRRYVRKAWPCSSLTKLGAYRRAWAESHLPNIGLNLFMELVAAEGFSPKRDDETGRWIIRFPGPSKKLADSFIRCEGL